MAGYASAPKLAQVFIWFSHGLFKLFKQRQWCQTCWRTDRHSLPHLVDAFLNATEVPRAQLHLINHQLLPLQEEFLLFQLLGVVVRARELLGIHGHGSPLRVYHRISFNTTTHTKELGHDHWYLQQVFVFANKHSYWFVIIMIQKVLQSKFHHHSRLNKVINSHDIHLNGYSLFYYILMYLSLLCPVCLFSAASTSVVYFACWGTYRTIFHSGTRRNMYLVCLQYSSLYLSTFSLYVSGFMLSFFFLWTDHIIVEIYVEVQEIPWQSSQQSHFECCSSTHHEGAAHSHCFSSEKNKNA